MRRFPLFELQLVIALVLTSAAVAAACWVWRRPTAPLPVCFGEIERLAGIAAAASASGGAPAARSALQAAARQSAACSVTGAPLRLTLAQGAWALGCEHLGEVTRDPAGWRGPEALEPVSEPGPWVLEHTDGTPAWALLACGVLVFVFVLRALGSSWRAQQPSPTWRHRLRELGAALLVALVIVVPCAAPWLLWTPELHVAPDGALTRDLDLPFLDATRAPGEVVAVLAPAGAREVSIVVRDGEALTVWRTPAQADPERAAALAARLRARLGRSSSPWGRAGHSSASRGAGRSPATASPSGLDSDPGGARSSASFLADSAVRGGNLAAAALPWRSWRSWRFVPYAGS